VIIAQLLFQQLIGQRLNSSGELMLEIAAQPGTDKRFEESDDDEVGRMESAREEIDLLVAGDVFAQPKRVPWFGLMGALSFVAAALGDQSLAKKAHSALEPHAGQMLVIGFCSFCWGSVDHLLAVLLSTMNRWDEAELRFESAIRICTRAGLLPCLARVQFDYARMLRDSGRSGCGRFGEIVTSSAGLATELEMRRLYAKLKFEWPELV